MVDSTPERQSGLRLVAQVTEVSYWPKGSTRGEGALIVMVELCDHSEREHGIQRGDHCGWAGLPVGGDPPEAWQAVT
jgi:hypothetical protein